MPISTLGSRGFIRLFISELFRLSKIILPPIIVNSPKANQWSKPNTSDWILLPMNQPRRGINAWKKAREKAIREAFQKVISHITKPHDTDTANESIERPTERSINVMSSIYYKLSPRLTVHSQQQTVDY
jgi:hypothetical protein